jgi:hypothetical protein
LWSGTNCIKSHWTTYQNPLDNISKPTGQHNINKMYVAFNNEENNLNWRFSLELKKNPTKLQQSSHPNPSQIKAEEHALWSSDRTFIYSY